jgi:endonuclease I/endonuclease/exonuclease/phosphatase family metal-dependent hydrolase
MNFKTIKCLIVSFILQATVAAFAAPPVAYYSSAEGRVGEELKAALHEIIDDHKELNYSEAYEALKILDRDPNDPDLVVGIYSKFKMNAAKKYDDGKGWNREHVWPKSFGNFGTRKGPGTDLHHLRASDVSTNSNRNNRSFAIGGKVFEDTHGNYHGVTECKKGSGVWTWEPPDNVKGDIARMVLYMAVRYEGDNGEPDLELVESIQKNSNKAPVLGIRSQIIQWHESDPVDAQERRRNDLIYEAYQRNRNPFIDRPEFVAAIWGTSNAPSTFMESVEAKEAEAEIPRKIEIGTYNLYWLGTEMRYRQGLRDQTDVKRIADFITEALDLEIVAFQEINTTMNGKFIFKGETRRMSAKRYKWLKKHMEDDGYKFIVGKSGDKQKIVIAYDADEVTLLSDAQELDSPSSTGRLRKPLAAKFKAGNFDFWVVSVHLKSQLGGASSDRIRTKQAKELLDAINNLISESGEKDVIILGDFNAEATDNSIDSLYRQGSFLTQTWKSRRSDTSGNISYLIGDFASLIDHILVRPYDTSELIEKSTTVYKPDNVDSYINGYSDHVPVWASFSTELDAD